MKDARWLPGIALLNVAVAAGFLLGFARWFAPGGLRLTPFFLFRLSVAALAIDTAIGLFMRKDWARRWSIVLWAIAMTFAIPVAIFGGIRFAVAGVMVGLTIAVGVPMLVISYLSQPRVKLALGAEDATYTGKKTIGFVLAGMGAGLLVILLVVNELMKAIGRGLR